MPPPARRRASRLATQLIVAFVAVIVTATIVAGIPAYSVIRSELERQAWARVEDARHATGALLHYVEWKRSDGAPLDPWIRVHWRLGAVPLGIAPNTLTVEGTVEEWEAWTGMAFPESGLYVVPGALQPVKIDCEQNTGRYEDPNYWMSHAVQVHPR